MSDLEYPEQEDHSGWTRNNRRLKCSCGEVIVRDIGTLDVEDDAVADWIGSLIHRVERLEARANDR